MDDSDKPRLDELLREAFAAVEFLCVDVDGVLTDGRLHFDPEGNEAKVFHVHDGAGLVYWTRAGLLAGIISGRRSRAVRERAQELGVQEVHLGHARKLDVLSEILSRRSIEPERVCYVGDDFLDLPAMEVVGLPVSVPQARPEVRAASRYVTRALAGSGAVREIVELLLDAKGLFEQILETLGVRRVPGARD